MNILVLGGTGAMGMHLVEFLSQRGDAVFVTSRRERPSLKNVTYVQGDAHDNDFLQTLLARQRWDAIVDFMVYKTEEFQRRVPVLLAATKQYVFLSSSRVYADSAEPITEDSPRLLDVSTDAAYLKTDEYALTKARQENALRADCKAGNWTIVRPYITYSEIRLQLGVLEKEMWLSRALRGQAIVFSNDIADRMTTLTYGYDVARGIAALIGNDRALGEAFHITCDRPIRWSEVLDVYLDVLESKTGRRPKVKMLDKSPFTYPQVVYDRYYNRIFDNTKMSAFIDQTTFIEPHAGLRRCLEAFLKKPRFDELTIISIGRIGMFDHISREQTPLSDFTGIERKVAYLLFRHYPAVAGKMAEIYRRIKYRTKRNKSNT